MKIMKNKNIFKKMFNKKILIILFLTIHLAISLKSTDFCIVKQQECKGFYNYKQNYQIECKLIKCHGKISYDCGSHLCSKNKADCNEYKNMKYYEKIYKYQGLNFNNMNLTEKLTHLKIFDKQVPICPNKAYKFNSKDFCLNGVNCIEKSRTFSFMIGSSISARQIDCECPSKQRFKCGKYCVADSLACSYFKPVNGKIPTYQNKIKDCGNDNVTRTAW